MNTVADAIRKVVAKIQTAIDDGEQSRVIDADDLLDVLLEIAETIDPEVLV